MAVSDNIDDFLNATQWMAHLMPDSEMASFLRDADNLIAVCRRVDAGFGMSKRAVEKILALALQVGTLTAANVYWRSRGREVLFERDGLYTDTRFQFVIGYQEKTWGSLGDRFAALGQLRRMCEAGLADPTRMGALITKNPGDTRFAGQDEFLFACLPAELSGLELQLERARQVQVQARLRHGSNAPAATSSNATAKISARLDTALRIREEFFKEHWLRAALNDTEWAEVHDLDAGILRGLYPQVWTGGYEGYRQRMVGQVVAHA